MNTLDTLTVLLKVGMTSTQRMGKPSRVAPGRRWLVGMSPPVLSGKDAARRTGAVVGAHGNGGGVNYGAKVAEIGDAGVV